MFAQSLWLIKIFFGWHMNEVDSYAQNVPSK